jgi:hypothetical protein
MNGIDTDRLMESIRKGLRRSPVPDNGVGVPTSPSTIIPTDNLMEALTGSRGMKGAAMSEPLQPMGNDVPKWWERKGVESMGRLQGISSIADNIKSGDNTLLRPRDMTSGIDRDALMAAIDNKGDGATLQPRPISVNSIPVTDTLPAPVDMSAQGASPRGLSSALLSPRVPPQQFPPFNPANRTLLALRADAASQPLTTSSSQQSAPLLMRGRQPEVDPNISTAIRGMEQPPNSTLPPQISSAITKALSNSSAPDLGNGGLPASSGIPSAIQRALGNASEPNFGNGGLPATANTPASVKMGRPPEDNSPPGLRRQIRQAERLINDPAFKNDPDNHPPRWKAVIGSFLEGVAKFAAANPNAGASVLLGGIAPGVVAGINPKFWADSVHKKQIDDLMDRLKVEDTWSNQDRDARKDEAQIKLTNANADYAAKRPDLEAEKNKNIELDRRRKNIIALVNHGDEFDPLAPENADAVEEMRALGLPVVRRRANQQIVTKQDAVTGKITVVAVDRKTGQPAPASTVVGDDGKPVTMATPTSVASADRAKALSAAAQRQKVAIEAAEKAQGRTFTHQEKMEAIRTANARVKEERGTRAKWQTERDKIQKEISDNEATAEGLSSGMMTPRATRQQGIAKAKAEKAKQRLAEWDKRKPAGDAGSGQYEGKVFNRSDLPAIAKKLSDAHGTPYTEEEAEEFVTLEGGEFK